MSSWSATFGNSSIWSGGTSNGDLHCRTQDTKSLETEYLGPNQYLAAKRHNVVLPPLKNDDLVSERSPRMPSELAHAQHTTAWLL